MAGRFAAWWAWRWPASQARTAADTGSERSGRSSDSACLPNDETFNPFRRDRAPIPRQHTANSADERLHQCWRAQIHLIIRCNLGCDVSRGDGLPGLSQDRQNCPRESAVLERGRHLAPQIWHDGGRHDRRIKHRDGAIQSLRVGSELHLAILGRRDLARDLRSLLPQG
jgi:hypothetical protein